MKDETKGKLLTVVKAIFVLLASSFAVLFFHFKKREREC